MTVIDAHAVVLHRDLDLANNRWSVWNEALNSLNSKKSKKEITRLIGTQTTRASFSIQSVQHPKKKPHGAINPGRDDGKMLWKNVTWQLQFPVFSMLHKCCLKLMKFHPHLQRYSREIAAVLTGIQINKNINDLMQHLVSTMCIQKIGYNFKHAFSDVSILNLLNWDDCDYWLSICSGGKNRMELLEVKSVCRISNLSWNQDHILCEFEGFWSSMYTIIR